MMPGTFRNTGLSRAVVAALCLSFTACATRSHVREAIAPLQTQADELDRQLKSVQVRAGENRERIGDLDRRLASADERSASARAKSIESAGLANRAAQTASAAGARADAAMKAAERAQSAILIDDQKMRNILAPLKSYRLVSNERIYFEFSQSGLNPEELQKLDRTLQKLTGMKNYMVEVEGFADSSGGLAANRALSRKRAAAVTHYLVVRHGVPLRTVFELAAGADFPNADNQTPSARRENRRVDVRIYSLDTSSGLASSNSGSQP